MPDPVEIFEAQRQHLLAIDYEMLGSVSDAEDVVQDAFLRWQRVHAGQIDSPRRRQRATADPERRAPPDT